MKKCSKCKENKVESKFYKRGEGLYAQCKTCTDKEHKEYVDKNRKDVLEQRRQYRLDNKKALSDKRRKHYLKNIEIIKNKRREYYYENKEFLLKQVKAYRKDNKERIIKQKRVYEKNKKEKDPVYKLYKRVSSSITSCMCKKGYTKKSRTYEILGVDYKFFLSYLNTNLYGFKYEEGIYDIDHIIPISSASTEEEVYLLSNYLNFQLLPSRYNRVVKRDNPWNEIEFKKWLKENEKRVRSYNRA